MKKVFLLLLIVTVVPLALFVIDHQFARRTPASENNGDSLTSTNDHDLSEATPEEFKKAFKYQILKEAKLQMSSEGPGLQLGSFLLKNSEGNKVFVCEEYPTMDLIFAADGVAHSGEIPHMIVRGPCLTDADQRHIEALSIPLEKILKGALTQKEFTFDLPDSREKIHIYFRYVVESWPTEWSWVGVKLYGKKPDETLQINGYEIISVLGEPLVLPVTPNE